MTYLSQFSHGWPSGAYRLPANLGSVGTDSAPSTSAKRTWLPFVIPDTSFLLSEVGLVLATAQAGAECRFGLWDDDEGKPGDLIADFGTLDLSSGSGWKFVSTSQSAPQGAVWVSTDLKNVGTQVTLRRIAATWPGFVHAGIAELTTSTFWRYWEQSITYGSALPSTAGVVSASVGTDCPITALRRA